MLVELNKMRGQEEIFCNKNLIIDEFDRELANLLNCAIILKLYQHGSRRANALGSLLTGVPGFREDSN
jgi:hypothetical protein